MKIISEYGYESFPTSRQLVEFLNENNIAESDIISIYPKVDTCYLNPHALYSEHIQLIYVKRRKKII